MSKLTVGIIGLGFVGGAMKKSFELKDVNVKGYDKYKESDDFEDVINCDFIFLCLPTLYDYNKGEYDKSIIESVCNDLKQNNYNGGVIIKSTVEPNTTENLYKKYKLNLLHNPEFLTAVTAFEDFHDQKHIVLGNFNFNENQMDKIYKFYSELYPLAAISICSSKESESMKLFCNTFYAVKIQFFNELFVLCQNTDCNYERILGLMLTNNWINPMHTKVPGPDGQLSYGGFCFPKDTNALLQHMKKNNSPCKLLEASIEERNQMRKDNTNCIEIEKNA